ncbi:MAG: Hsp20/alpha crystallin family protein [Deltaproteobacteria bacterium]|nr:MAG: Hsp20/alpha crystallin family protein [Deltaproteobacteria bacterium]
MGEQKRSSSKVPLRERRRGEERRVISPPVDIFETPEGLFVLIEVPGVPPESISVTVSGPHISVSGEKKLEENEASGRYIRLERHYGKFQKNFEVIGAFNTSLTEVTVKNGVLTMFVPRCEERRGKEIRVNVTIDRSGEGELG